MSRYYNESRGQIYSDDDPGVFDDVDPGHAAVLQQMDGVGFLPLLPVAAAASLIPGKPLTLARRRGGKAPTGAPQISPTPTPTTDAGLRRELAKVQAAERAARAEVASERAKAQKALKDVEAKLAAERAAEAKLKTQLAKAQAKATGDRREYDKALGQYKAKLAEAQRARDAAIAAGDKAAAAELQKLKAAKAKSDERAAAELKARNDAEAKLATQEAAAAAHEAELKKRQAKALKAREAELAKLRDQLNAQGDTNAALKAEQQRTQTEAARYETEHQARLAAEKRLAAAQAALSEAKKAAATAKAPSSGEMTPKQAAVALRDYLKAHPTAAGFGYKANPNPQVQTYQRYLGTSADGIVGKKTRKAASAQGVTLPPRPSSNSSTNSSTLTPAQEQGDTVQAAGLKLRDYLTAHPTARAFGTKGNPSAPVIEFQRAAGITADGIVGNQVRTAAKNVGVTIPPRP